MARINIVNADNKIDATPQRAYFKLKQTGGPKGEKGDTGAQGPQGATGPQGASASVVVNSTTTLPAGSDATVENIGTPQNVKLNFGIPTGPQGPQGEQGPQGAQGPQGLKGDTGAKGADGAAAKVTVGNTNTGAAGTNAIVENIGSDTFAVLNFTIPRGDKGETGPMPDIAQTTGQATDEVMSQKATTDALGTKQNILTAGTGITIASDTVSADTTVLATKADLNDYAPQATTYTKTETDALLAPKLEADVVASLPETGEEGKLYLTPKNYTTGTASGNPITIALGEDAGQISSAQLDGDTEQQSYTGKNLFNKNNYSDQTGYYIGGNGIWRSGGVNDHYFVFNIEPNTTYTFSKNAQASNNRFRVGISSEAPTVGVAFPIWGGGDTATEITLTTDSDSKYAYVYYSVTVNMQEAIQSLQIELGSTATSYEPYVGGTPAPNPDYPQPIQTVTGEQNIDIVGKNLCSSDWESGIYDTTTGAKATGAGYRTAGFIQVEPDTAYIVSRASVGVGMNVLRYDKNKNFLTSSTVTAGNSFTTASNVAYITMFRGTTGGIAEMMLQKGSTITTYTPYAAQNLTVNLGTIELCKLGTYQDYIWKDGEEWKVHKELDEKTADVSVSGISGTSSGYTTASSNGAFSISKSSLPEGVDALMSENIGTYKLDTSLTANTNANSMQDGTFCPRQGTADRLYFRNTAYTGKTGDELKATLLAKSGGTNVVYTLATPTDTTITDATLIAQLEAVRTAALSTGSNTISNTATGTNLAGDLELAYCEFDPTNRYDKWLWLDLNNAYEQLGS